MHPIRFVGSPNWIESGFDAARSTTVSGASLAHAFTAGAPLRLR